MVLGDMVVTQENIIISITSHSLIQAYSKEGEFEFEIKDLVTPTGLADSNEMLFICEQKANRVKALANYKHSHNIGDMYTLIEPIDIKVNGRDQLFVLHFMYPCANAYSFNGVLVSKLGWLSVAREVTQINRLAVSQSTLFISTGRDSTIKYYTNESKVCRELGWAVKGVNEKTQIHKECFGIFVVGDKLLVCDMENKMIKEFEI